MCRFFFFIQFLLLPVAVMAQQDDAQSPETFTGGITVGANFSSLRGDVYDGYRKLGLNIGATVDVRFSKMVTATMELLYSQKGCRGIREVNSNYVGAMFEKYFVNLNYMEVPLLVLFTGRPKINAGGGVSYSRLLSSNEWIETDQPYVIDNNLHRFRDDDWAFVVAGNYLFNPKWMVSFRYQRSIRPIRAPYFVPLSLGTGNQFNSYFTMRLTYHFL